jgi:hypothetical protein
LTLSERTRDLIVQRTGAVEVAGADGPALLAGDPASATGVMRVYRGAADSPVEEVVWTALQVPARGVTTCMIFAFTRPESALPHFTLDCSDRGGDGHAFHLDLVPRVELATHLAYLDEVFDPLTPHYEAASALAGLSGTRTTRRQFAMMTPWMLVHMATPQAFAAIGDIVDAYLQHWLNLLASGLSAPVAASVGDTDLAARDAAFRANFFHPDVDPVWGRVEAMLGADAAAAIRSQLTDGSSVN